MHGVVYVVYIVRARIKSIHVYNDNNTANCCLYTLNTTRIYTISYIRIHIIYTLYYTYIYIYIYRSYLYDSERGGYKGPRREELGLEFLVEHYTWKRLPTAIFAAMGGREVCKVRRAEVLALKETAEKGTEKGAAGGTEKGTDNEGGVDSIGGKRGIGQGGEGGEGGGGKRARFDSGLGLSGTSDSSSVNKSLLFKPLPLLRPAPLVRPVRKVITGATWVMLPSSTTTS